MQGEKNNLKPMTSGCALFISSLLVGFFVVWFLWVSLEWEPLTYWFRSSAAAAWAQAIGSFAAILVTAYIARRDTRMRNDEKDALHAKEMRKISYYFNNSGLPEQLFLFENRINNFEVLSLNNIKFEYKYIYLFIAGQSLARSLNETLIRMDSVARMELETSVLSDEFFSMFNAINGISGQFEVDYPNVKFDKNLFFIKSYIKMLSENDVDTLNDFNQQLSISMDFAKMCYFNLREAESSIRFKLNESNLRWT